MTAATRKPAGDSLWRDAVRRLRRDRVAVVAFLVICAYVAVALAAEASRIARVIVASDKESAAVAEEEASEPVAALAWLAGWLDPGAPQEAHQYHPPSWVERPEMGKDIYAVEEAEPQDAEAPAAPPVRPRCAETHLLGTNVHGSDVLARIAVGTKIALQVGLVAGLIAVAIGGALGALAGWFGGWVDEVVVWIYSTVASIPGILLIIGLSYMLKELGEDWKFYAIFLAMGLTYWVGVCRLVRGEVLKLRDRDYVLAARALGCGQIRILFLHVMPNVFHLVIISFTLLFVQAIKAEVVVSFLGVGVVGMPSWGLLIQDASVELTKGMWWQMTFTSIALFGLVLAFQVFGDALRDALDPRLRQ